MLRTGYIFAVVFIVFTFSTHPDAGEKNNIIKIGIEEQLFVDNYLIERTENITRSVNRAEKSDDPVIIADRPWEGGVVLLFGSVLYDEESSVFKMWYYCDGGHVAYATSKDGLNWEKPELDIVLRNGEKTNIVIERNSFGHNYEIMGIIKDIRETVPSRRYKAGFVSIEHNYSGEFEDPYHPGSRRGLGVAVSHDGVHWTSENEFASYEVCDISRFFWDASLKRYVLYGRTKLTSEKNDGRWKIYGWGRAVIRLESVDFRNWSKGELIIAADHNDPPGTEIYSMSVFPYEGIYIGLVQVFYGLPDQGNLEIQIASSRNGTNFSRLEPYDPFIPEGAVGDWDRFNISIGNMPPVTVGDELWFYYSGRNYRHGPYNGKDSGQPRACRIGLARIKRGRFVLLEASFDGGYVLTRALIFQGSQLYINANAAFGSIHVTLLNEQGKVITGWESTVSGKDDIAIPVHFEKGTLGKFSDKPVRIKFTLSNSQLYGFSVK